MLGECGRLLAPRLVPLVRHPRVLLSRYEPALSLYREGGSFEPHQDGESLTILIPLSEADASFSGGGTAFWAPPTFACGEEAPFCEAAGGAGFACEENLTYTATYLTKV